MRPGIEGAASMLYNLDLAALAPTRAVARMTTRPVLLIHGSLDPVIPVDHARRLKHHAANAKTELWILDGMGHAEGARSGPCHRASSPRRRDFLERIVSFMDAALGSVDIPVGPCRVTACS
jgi:fermentation-respiration switch protein FrsA (DUF1100 family)